MNGNFRNLAIWMVILVMLLGLFQIFQTSSQTAGLTQKTYSQFVSDVDAGSVQSVTITENRLRGTLNGGQRFETYLPEGVDVVSRLERAGVTIEAQLLNQAHSGRFFCRHGCRSL